MSKLYLGDELIGSLDSSDIKYDSSNSVKNKIDTLNSSISTNTTNISKLTTNVNNNTSNVNSLKTNVESNTNDISSLQSTVGELNENLTVRYNKETDKLQIYYNGQWNDINIGCGLQSLVLYDNGVEETTISGGWAGYAYKSSTSSASTVKAPTLTKDDTYMKATLSGSGTVGIIATGNAIDLTSYSGIKIKYETSVSNASGTLTFGVTAERKNNYVKATGVSVLDNTEITLDISGLTGSYYLYFSLVLSTIKIYSIELIK